MFQLPSISLYIHIPWCLKKCAYCDFYSYVKHKDLPEKEYIKHLLRDLERDLLLINQREIKTIFIGGGTPSLLQNKFIKKLILGIKKRVKIANNAEISIEANPKKLEYARFCDYKNSGINRFSLGIQTFNTSLLEKIGRTYNQQEVYQAILKAKKAHENINLDLMYGLPNQNLKNVLSDLKYAVKCQPSHISWYQLSIEPHTAFYKKKLSLPHDDLVFQMVTEGNKFLKKSKYKRYEISSYAKINYQCQHNLNYWNFGDYIGIGCGAHGKITKKNGDIIRTIKNKSMKNFLNGKYLCSLNIVLDKDKPFEYFMNTFRLYQKISKKHFQENTNICINKIQKNIQKAINLGYLIEKSQYWRTTIKGKNYLNDLLEIFLQ